MACTGHERGIVDRLLQDSATPLKICASAFPSDSKDSKEFEDSKHSNSTCYVPRSLLASVSPKLVDTCSRGLHLTHVSDKVIRMFVTWLLYRRLDMDESEKGSTQTRLAQAWNFGAEYEIPGFQDNRVHPDAVVEAYRPLERGSLLQKAFVQQLASDREVDIEGIVWTREDFTGCALGTDPQLLLDLQFAGEMGDVEDFLSSASGDA
ncbi:hypothetical protein MBLNU13_g00607t1 [Cladosporium sp. NU13]